MIRALVLCLLAAAAVAQQPQSTPAANAAVSGVVKDAGTGQPLANYNVSTYVNATWVGETIIMGQAKQVKSVTDDQGRYRISDLPPGPYRIEARSAEIFGSGLERRVVISGQDLDHIDFLVKVGGIISGKVTDENKEPVPGASVALVSREYFSGVLGYFYKDFATADDRGRYTLRRVQAGHPYLIVATRRASRGRMAPWSDAPLDPRLRRLAPEPTFFPDSPSRDGGSLVTIRPGEHREGVDIEMKRTANYCISGTIEGPAGPAGLNFGIEPLSPSMGQSSGGGFFGVAPGGMTGPDGKFRICDLNPGTYRVTAFDRFGGGGPNAPQSNYALLSVPILDQDISGIRLVVSPGMRLDGEVILDGPVPEQPLDAKVNINFTPLQRAELPGERPGATSEIPGTFSVAGLLPTDYAGLRLFLRKPGLYVKDARLGASSVLYDPLHLGGSMAGTTLRVIVGRDGATFTAHVAGKNGQPVADARVLAFPAEVSSEGMLQAALKSGQTNQLGQYTSVSLAPGKYYVAALDATIEATPESIGQLWRARNRCTEVELTPNGTAQVQLEVIKLE